MPINNRELLHAVEILATQENLQVTVTQSAKGALLIGTCAFIGGILGGPAGLGVGGVFGSLCAAAKSSGKFRSVVEVIGHMTPAQRDELASAIRRAIQDVQIEDAILLVSVVTSRGSIQAAVLAELGNFLQKQMGLSIAQ